MTLRSAFSGPRQTPPPLPKFILKRGESYTVRYNVPADLQEAVGRKEVVRSLGTKNLKEALERREGVLEEIRKSLLEPRPAKPPKPGRYGDKQDPLTGTSITATAHRWLAQSDGIKNATKARYRQHLSAFAEFAGDIEVDQINRKRALDFIAYIQATPSERTGEKLAARSIGSYQVCLSAWWRVLDRWGLVDPDMRNPFSSLLRRVVGQRKKIDPREKKLRPVTREEAEAPLGSRLNQSTR